MWEVLGPILMVIGSCIVIGVVGIAYAFKLLADIEKQRVVKVGGQWYKVCSD